MALIDRDETVGTDRLASGVADFGNGRHLNFACSTQTVPHQHVQVLGSRAKPRFSVPFSAPPDQRTALNVDIGPPFDGSLARREIIPATNHFTEQAEAFALAVLGKKPLPWGMEDAIASMQVIDAIFESERTGGWAKV